MTQPPCRCSSAQSPNSQRWSEGAADSVRQWMTLLEGNPKTRSIQDVLVSKVGRKV